MNRYQFGSQSLNLAWLPRADGVFLKDDPQKLVELGSIANVPFVSGMFLFIYIWLTSNKLSVPSGCTDDEGTLFAISSRNVT